MLISGVIREKKQRLEVMNGGIGIIQCVLPNTNDPNPTSETVVNRLDRPFSAEGPDSEMSTENQMSTEIPVYSEIVQAPVLIYKIFSSQNPQFPYMKLKKRNLPAKGRLHDRMVAKYTLLVHHETTTMPHHGVWVRLYSRPQRHGPSKKLGPISLEVTRKH